MQSVKQLFRSVIIADDHLVVGQGIEGLVRSVTSSTRRVASGEDLLASIQQAAPDLVISDINMPGMDGIDAMKAVHESGVAVPFVFLTMYDEPSMAIMAMRAGARGYLPKTSAGGELIRALEAVAGGRTYIAATINARLLLSESNPQPVITSKQRRILQHLSTGLRNKQVAAEMGLSVRTVESHKYQLMQELGVHSTLELLRRAKATGLLDG